MDPVAVLDSGTFEYMVRVAAHNIIAADVDKANKEAEKKQRRK